jgi:hypothetical protein
MENSERCAITLVSRKHLYPARMRAGTRASAASVGPDRGAKANSTVSIGPGSRGHFASGQPGPQETNQHAACINRTYRGPDQATNQNLWVPVKRRLRVGLSSSNTVVGGAGMGLCMWWCVRGRAWCLVLSGVVAESERPGPPLTGHFDFSDSPSCAQTSWRRKYEATLEASHFGIENGNIECVYIQWKHEQRVLNGGRLQPSWSLAAPNPKAASSSPVQRAVWRRWWRPWPCSRGRRHRLPAPDARPPPLSVRRHPFPSPPSLPDPGPGSGWARRGPSGQPRRVGPPRSASSPPPRLASFFDKSCSVCGRFCVELGRWAARGTGLCYTDEAVPRNALHFLVSPGIDYHFSTFSRIIWDYYRRNRY